MKGAPVRGHVELFGDRHDALDIGADRDVRADGNRPARLLLDLVDCFRRHVLLEVDDGDCSTVLGKQQRTRFSCRRRSRPQ
jgi:hypothetical protein